MNQHSQDREGREVYTHVSPGKNGTAVESNGCGWFGNEQ
jgi:hypothetical protein